MSGNGTMPTVTLESPLERDQSGAVIMDFGEASARYMQAPLYLTVHVGGAFHSAVDKVE